MKYLLVFIASTFCFISCKSDCTVELNKSNQRIQNDSLLLASMGNEMEAIDTELSKITEFSISNEKTSPEKIKELSETINKSISKIKQLEETISKSNSSFKNSPTLLKSLEAQKMMIQQQQELIKDLVNKLKISDDEKSKLLKELGLPENTSASQMANLIKETIEKNKTEIEKTKAEIEKANNELVKKTNELKNVKIDIEKQKQTFIKQNEETYFKMANELVELAKEINRNKKTRSEMTVKAFNYYCNLHKSGNYLALQKIDELRKDKELGKFVVNLECSR